MKSYFHILPDALLNKTKSVVVLKTAKQKLTSKVTLVSSSDELKIDSIYHAKAQDSSRRSKALSP